MRDRKGTIDRINQYVGQRIRDARRARKPRLTQEQLARATNGEISRSTLASIERGRQTLSVAQLIVIANAIQVDVAGLLPITSEKAASVESKQTTKKESPEKIAAGVPEKDRAFVMGLLSDEVSQAGQ